MYGGPIGVKNVESSIGCLGQAGLGLGSEVLIGW